jgi:hypothetical protein
MRTIKILFLLLLLQISGLADEPMPWQTPVTVTAKVGRFKNGGWPYLQFTTPLSFKVSPEDPEDTYELKNLRRVPLMGDVDFTLLQQVIKLGRPISVTGVFWPTTTVHQPRPLMFSATQINDDLRQALKDQKLPAH